MGEQEPNREQISRGDLFYLRHPDTQDIFSGYGLVVKPGTKEFLTGLLMVDRPRPVDPAWLDEVKATYGEFQLVPMSRTGERGILCQMVIEPESLTHLQQIPSPAAAGIKLALEPFLEHPPKPVFSLHWDEETHLWRSTFAVSNELSPEIREVFERSGYGCLAAETNIGVVHVCHAPDKEIDGFAGKPMRSQWQLIKMPTAPLIRLELFILDRPENPYRFESFLNVAAEDQLQVLIQLANQDKLFLAFYGDWLNHRFTGVIEHSKQQWQQLDEIVEQALLYWESLPSAQRDFDQAKAEFMQRFV